MLWLAERWRGEEHVELKESASDRRDTRGEIHANRRVGDGSAEKGEDEAGGAREQSGRHRLSTVSWNTLLNRVRSAK